MKSLRAQLMDDAQTGDDHPEHDASWARMPEWKFELMKACIAKDHIEPPDQPCLECRILAIKGDDGKWRVVHYRTFINIAADYPGVSPESVMARAGRLGFPDQNIRSGN